MQILITCNYDEKVDLDIHIYHLQFLSFLSSHSEACSGPLLQTFLLGFVIVLCRGRRSAIQGEVDSDDFDESDDELLHA